MRFEIVITEVYRTPPSAFVVDIEHAYGAGPAGPGVSTGGTAGQVLTKVDGVDFNTVWATVGGGSVAWADVTGKPTTIVGFGITDFAESVDDRVAALLTAGSNVSIAYNDALNRITISATGGGGSGGGNSYFPSGWA